MLHIVGLGPGSKDLLPLKVYNLLRQHPNIYFRTEKHPVIDELKQEGIVFKTFDYLYDQEESFDLIYEKISIALIAESMSRTVVYGVPGHPMVAEKSVQKLLALATEKNIVYEIIPAMSFLEAIFSLLKIDPTKGINIIDALRMPTINIHSGYIITQVYDRMVASEVKLNLMEAFPDEHEITVIRAAGIPGEEKYQKMPLFELDRLVWIDYLTSVYVPALKEGSKQPNVLLDPLLEIMEQLRSVNGCPWDKEQTHESLKRYLIEETYEVLEAIDVNNMHKVCEELGDLLLQVVFHAQIAKEQGSFDIKDVITEICEKLIRRHPHVFGDVTVSGVEEVNANWNSIKAVEKLQAGEIIKSQLSGVPIELPALLRAEKIQKKAAEVGFDWPDYIGALDKITEEFEELKEAIKQNKSLNIKEELGDLIFAIVNLTRFFNVEPEGALTMTINKFISRFAYIEKEASTANKSLANYKLDELDKLWNEAKSCEK